MYSLFSAAELFLDLFILVYTNGLASYLHVSENVHGYRVNALLVLHNGDWRMKRRSLR